MSALPRSTESPPLSRRADTLRSQLDAYRRRLEACDDPESPGFATVMSGFLDFVRTYEDHEAYGACEEAGIVAEHRAFFAPRVLEFTWVMERRAYRELMSRPVGAAAGLGPLLEANPWGAYAGVGETLQLVDLTSCARLLMVGCGPLPDTLLYVHGRADVPVLVGVERDPEARRMARDLVERFRQYRIEIRDGDGLHLDYGGFDLICCSVFATPRRAIMERIARTADSDATMLLRDPSFTGTLLFDSVLDALPARFEIRARSGPQPRGRLMLSYYVLGLR